MATPSRNSPQSSRQRSKDLERLTALQTELEARIKARDSLIAFTQWTYSQYRPARHHRLIADKLEAVARGEIDRLMIFMPPRHGKSELASVRFPAWYLGRYPNNSIIAASYNSDLASDFGRQVRNIVGSPEYHALYATRLAEDSKAADRWHTREGGSYVSAGVGTGVTGRGAHILLIDDPFKDREEADSERYRDRVWGWYTSVAYTRLESTIAPDTSERNQIVNVPAKYGMSSFVPSELIPENPPKISAQNSGAVVIINTRWHEDDLTGRLLAEEKRGGDKWEVLDLPAQRDGEALWPEKYPWEQLERIRKAIGPRDFSALYMQKPSPQEGLFFKREWVRWYDEFPAGMHIYGASDYAVSKGGGDWTVHGVFGVDAVENVYVLEWWRGQTSSDVWVERFLDLVKGWRPLLWGEEKGQIIKSLGPFIDKRSIERKIFVAREQIASVRDKESRAQSFRGRMAMGKVFFPNTLWGRELVERIMTFPTGVDDDVDVLGLFGRMLDKTVGVGSGSSRAVSGSDRWDKAFGREPERDWKTL